MFALAKRSVVSENVDVCSVSDQVLSGRQRVCLSIGFIIDHATPEADITLARYTCVALQRLDDSAMKVKGRPAH